MKTFIKNGVDLKNEIGSNTLKFLNERLSIVESEVSNIETIFENFKSVNGITDLNKDAEVLLDGVKNYDLQLDALNSQIKIADDLYQYAISRKDFETMSFSLTNVADPVLANICNEIIRLEGQRQLLKTTVTKDNPLYVNLGSQIFELKRTLVENLKSYNKNLNVSKGIVTSKLGKFETGIKQMPKTERQMIEIRRQLEIKNNLFIHL